MDAKDLRTESSMSERINNGNAKYTQGSTVLQCNRKNPYQDIGSNSLGKVEVQTARPCAVIGPDRIVPPPPVSTDAYMKKTPMEPWAGDNIYRQPPEYPHKISDYHLPTRNISPRQTFQENMQRIMVPPSYNATKLKEDHNFPVDANMSPLRNAKSNVPNEAKYCEVPYSVNPITSEQKTVRNPDVSVSNMNAAHPRNVPHAWPPGSATIRPPKPFGAPEMYQYVEYPSCGGPRAMVMSRSQRTVHEDPPSLYSDPFYHDGSLRFKPYPPVKERYPQARYDYIGNYSAPFHPPHLPPHKYDLQKTIPSHPYTGYSQVPLKYLDSRIPEQFMNGYQRPLNPQHNFNHVPFRNQVMHSGYGPVPSNCLQTNKYFPYPTDSSVKPIIPNKLPYDTAHKMYAEYENSRTKSYGMSDNFYVNEMGRQVMKGQIMPPSYPSVNIHHLPAHPYYRKENPTHKQYEYNQQFRNIDQPININGATLSRLPSQFSPGNIAISPSDSNTSNETSHTQGTLPEDCGYISQSSTASIRSMESGITRIPYDPYKRFDYRYGPIPRTSPLSCKQETYSKNKKGIDVRQFLQMWNEGEEDNSENTTKDVSIKSANATDIANNHFENSKQDQLYVLGLVNVPSEELSKYEHIQKVSKLPENIKGYNSIELLNQFEEVIESSNLNHCNFKPHKSRDYIPLKGQTTMHTLGIPSRPLSPLDVEAKISQSVIHKEVGCNFEIKPCSPKMLNVEVPTPVQSLNERSIKKVSNHLIISDPINQNISDDVKKCTVINHQDHRIPKDHTKDLQVPSCKMVNTKYDSMSSGKTDYSLQDLESNSGVCLASLPRLDNDIELSFPEVNQQFINANKVESVITVTPKDLPDLDQPLIDEDPNDKKRDTSKSDGEKVQTKLSKYRKQKRKESESVEIQQEANAQTLRTDSVIIKNPENKNIEENFKDFSNSISEKTNQIILSIEADKTDNDSKVDFDHNNCSADTPNTLAIDFSLNSNINSVSNITDTEPKYMVTDNRNTKSLDDSYEPKYMVTDNRNTKSLDYLYVKDALKSICSPKDVPSTSKNLNVCLNSDEATKLDIQINSDIISENEIFSFDNSDTTGFLTCADTNNDINVIKAGNDDENLSSINLLPSDEADSKVMSYEKVQDMICDNNQISHEMLRNSKINSDSKIKINDLEVSIPKKEILVEESKNVIPDFDKSIMDCKKYQKTYCRVSKELLSPSIQNLILFCEGLCSNSKQKSDNISSSSQSLNVIDVHNKYESCESIINEIENNEAIFAQISVIGEKETVFHNKASFESELCQNNTKVLVAYSDNEDDNTQDGVQEIPNVSQNPLCNEDIFDGEKRLPENTFVDFVKNEKDICDDNTTNDMSVPSDNDSDSNNSNAEQAHANSDNTTKFNSCSYTTAKNLPGSNYLFNTVNNGDNVSPVIENNKINVPLELQPIKLDDNNDNLIDVNDSKDNLITVNEENILEEETKSENDVTILINDTVESLSLNPKTAEISNDEGINSTFNESELVDDINIRIGNSLNYCPDERDLIREATEDIIQPSNDKIGNESKKYDTDEIEQNDIETMNTNLSMDQNCSKSLANEMEYKDFFFKSNQILKHTDKADHNKTVKTTEVENSNTLGGDIITNEDIPQENNEILHKGNKNRSCLKRSLSDSVLNLHSLNFRPDCEQDFIEDESLWPAKRKRLHFQNFDEPAFITNNYTNVIHANRRNSISSIFNKENVSFCILIDNDCIITEDESINEKICYTELTDNCISCIESDGTLDNESTESSVKILAPAEINSECSKKSYLLDSAEDKSIEEVWVQDVACVETVISDDVAEDVELSASSSPKSIDTNCDESNNNESTLFDVNNHSDKVKYIYGEEMCSSDAQLVETLYRTPQMEVTALINRESHLTDEFIRCYNNESLEDILSDYNNDTFKTTYESPKCPINISPTPIQQTDDSLINDLNLMENSMSISKSPKNSMSNLHSPLLARNDTAHSCEYSCDNMFSYDEREENSNYTVSSSPEVSSTTSEEKNSSILLKITNYGGSRIAQINETHSNKKHNTVSCKYTETKDYISTDSNLPVRPLITKAAQKYIPPLKETIRDLKVKLHLPSQSLMKLKQLKKSKEEPKPNKNNFVNIIRNELPKKIKPKFEDVLKSIDEINFKNHKEKNKKIKKYIPKVVIKKNENGSHYASTSNVDKYNPDLTGRKWQPWVFLDKNYFIDKMAIKNKTKAIFSHRKNTYVLAESFKKYKSICSSTRFVISQPETHEPSAGKLKYTIRLKHTY